MPEVQAAMIEGDAFLVWGGLPRIKRFRRSAPALFAKPVTPVRNFRLRVAKPRQLNRLLQGTVHYQAHRRHVSCVNEQASVSLVFHPD